MTEDQARHIYKKVEADKIINIETMKQEIEDDRLTRNRIKEGEGDEIESNPYQKEIEDDRLTRNRIKEEERDEIESNPYQMAILNKTSRDDTKIEQMINWSILSDLIKYVDRSSCSDIIPSLTMRPLDYRKHKRLYNSLKTDEDLTSDIVFEGDRVKDIYLDRYYSIYAEILQATRFDESTDVSTTYLGKADMTREQVVKAEERFLIAGQAYTYGKLLDHTECSILIDTGASKSYMLKTLHVM